jgi:DNA-binding HxlR family transcriptional regulator
MKLDCKTESIEYNGKRYPCGTSLAMGFIGGKWKAVILHQLMEGEMRYSGLRKGLPVVTERTLSLQLKQMEKDGLISRRQENVKPPLKVTYALTDFGKTLIPLLNMLLDWGNGVALEKGTVVAK